MSCQVFGKGEVGEIDGSCVLDDDLVDGFEITVGQQRRRTHDLFRGTDVRDDDWRWIVAGAHVTACGTIATLWRSSAV